MGIMYQHLKHDIRSLYEQNSSESNSRCANSFSEYAPHHIKTILWPFFWDHPYEPVPEEKLLDFMVQGKINRGRHTDHPAGRHSIRTNQCPPPSSPIWVCRSSIMWTLIASVKGY